uniref:Cadherin N-terminal domain-containing protein n=1 Tax=Oryzias melastigma TaxID=30732 RepID=A0A3B3D115_ORYME
ICIVPMVPCRMFDSFESQLVTCFGAFAQIRYSVSEEVQGGTVVGNIAKDLGLDKNALKLRGYRIVADSSEPLFEVNQSDGNLYLRKKIDREEVCEKTLMITSVWKSKIRGKMVKYLC